MSEQRVKTRKNIIWLGLVSLFNDLSSEVIARVLPLYLISVVKTTFVGIGVIEAISEATSILGKLFSGYYSDKFARRKPMVFFGYAISVISRPLIILSPTVGAIGFARFVDKVGKSVRTPPRDALIADLSTEKDRGLNFGINRSLDTLGAVLGLAAVAYYIHRTGGSEKVFRTIIIAACLAGVLALFALLFGVDEPARKKPLDTKRFHLSLQGMSPVLRRYLWIAGVLTLANSSDAFIIVRARELDFSYEKIFILLTCFNIIAAISGYFLGSLSDVWGRKIMLIFGWSVYAVSYLVFGQQDVNLTLFWGAVVCYGLYYGFTEGVEKALIADLEPGLNKGQAYGWLGLVQGLCVVPANLIFAGVYQKWGARSAFTMSAVFALIGIIWLLFLNPTTVGVVRGGTTVRLEELKDEIEDGPWRAENEAEEEDALESGADPQRKNYITPQGMKKLQTEYHELFHNERPKLVETVSWAASNGDRSENGDYIYGKRRLREIDRRLRFLGRRMANAVIVNAFDQPKDQVLFGAKVTVEDEGAKKVIYNIVGEDEIDLEKRKISWVSPIAKALMHGKVGDSVIVQRPNGETELTIVKIEYVDGD